MSHTYLHNDNNPVDWFGSDYDFSSSMGVFQIDMNMFYEDAVGGPSGTLDGQSVSSLALHLNETTGDVRYVYFVLMRYLFDKYTAKKNSSTHVMPRAFKMTRSQVRDRENDKRHTTYTITFVENESSVTDTVGSRFLTPESQL